MVGWLVGRVRCRLCNNLHIAVSPAETGLEDLECPRCGNMTCDVVESADEAVT